MRNLLRSLFALLFTAFALAAVAQEYKRPTADATASADVYCFTAGTNGTNVASSSLSAAYASKSGTGPTGSSASMSVTGTLSAVQNSARVFTGFSTASTYSALTLYLSVSCTTTTNGVGGSCGASYSTNSGSTWTNLYYYNNTAGGADAQHTVSAVITGATLANVRVKVCTRGYTDFSSIDDTGTVVTYDLWTAGTIASSSKKKFFYTM